MSEDAASLPLVIRDYDGRGACLDYSHDGTRWLPLSFHANEQEAREYFDLLPRYVDRDPDHYRVVCHSLDTMEAQCDCQS